MRIQLISLNHSHIIQPFKRLAVEIAKLLPIIDNWINGILGRLDFEGKTAYKLTCHILMTWLHFVYLYSG